MNGYATPETACFRMSRHGAGVLAVKNMRTALFPRVAGKLELSALYRGKRPLRAALENVGPRSVNIPASARVSPASSPQLDSRFRRKTNEPQSHPGVGFLRNPSGRVTFSKFSKRPSTCVVNRCNLDHCGDVGRRDGARWSRILMCCGFNGGLRAFDPGGARSQPWHA